MLNRQETSPLFSHFLTSDVRLWVRFVPALPLQAAYYYDAHFGGGVLHRYLLHFTKLESTWRAALEIGSHTPGLGGSLIFDATSTARELLLDSSSAEITRAEWPALHDPLLRKAREIVLACGDRYGPSPLPTHLARSATH